MNNKECAKVPCNVSKGRKNDANDKSIWKALGIALVTGGGFFLFAWIIVLIPAWYIASPETYLMVAGLIAIIIFGVSLALGIIVPRQSMGGSKDAPAKKSGKKD